MDGPISILIGPNGGGKTNLLDAGVIALRKYLLWSWSKRIEGNPVREEFRRNERVDQLILAKNREAPDADQIIELEIEVTQLDIENMIAMQRDAEELDKLTKSKYAQTVTFGNTRNWPAPLPFSNGDRLAFKIVNGSLGDESIPNRVFRNYLELYEVDSMLREELGKAPLALPLLSLPTSRSTSGFANTVSLPNFDQFDHKRSIDAATSKAAGGLIEMALGRLAIKHRLLREKERANADFENDEVVKSLKKHMKRLGYGLDIECIDPLKNEYRISWEKDGKSFAVGDSSSGEKEFLTYLFGIYGLQIRDALIVVDEPELHLHPRWQKSLLRLFEDLAADTGNQFLLATHSPAFVSPSSIQYVSRVYAKSQQSQIVRLNNTSLPNPKHLFAIVNSQNNERIFFTNKVVLVEGISDRIVFERLSETYFKSACAAYDFEIVSVGGKGFFEPYKLLLDACGVSTAIVGDQDYISDVAPNDIKQLFPTNGKKIGKDINAGESLDAASLFAKLDDAIQTGDSAELRKLWEYIKDRRRDTRALLTAAEEARVGAYLKGAENKGVFILREGAIEAYLPAQYREKDIDKLIEFVQDDNFASKMDPASLTELGRILTAAIA